MKLFRCHACGQLLFFENTACENCGRRVGYLPDRETMSAVEPDGPSWIALAAPEARYRFCANWEESACNWLVPAEGLGTFCRACQHNRTIPNLADPTSHFLWQRIEDAKRRLFYTLLRLDLPVPSVASGDPEPLVFDFLADPPSGPRVMTGHDNGLITISLSEADDAERERIRTRMHEPYRTLLGHFRHEVGHFYWDRLVRDGGRIEECRAVFGDERDDYDGALQRHYAHGAPPDWRGSFVSSYATMHPWEDWAETWAHYLHIVDTLEMAGAFGIRVDPAVADIPLMPSAPDFDPHDVADINLLIGAWVPLTIAVNGLNRAMGQPDLYPFVLGPAVVAKLAFIQSLVRPRPAA